jgi:hypothetical protein
MRLVWYQLRFPNDLDPDSIVHFIRTLAARPRRGALMVAEPVICEVQGQDGRLSWRLGVTSSEERQVLTSLRQAVPDMRADAFERPSVRYDTVWELRLSSQRRVLQHKTPDQVAGIVLSALQRAGNDEYILLRWQIGPWLPRAPIQPPNSASATTSIFDIDQLVLNSEQVRVLRDKHAEALFGVVGRIAVKATGSSRQRVLRQGVVGGLQLLRSPGVGIERRAIPSAWTKRRFDAYQQPLIGWPLNLNAAELAACLCWPAGHQVLPGVEFTGHRHLPPSQGQLIPIGSEPTKRRRITGKSTFPGMPGLLTLSADDGLRGLHCVGPTGTGKSNLLASLALQDIEAGRAVVVVDPKRDLIDAIADRIPANRINDVVIIDPTDKAPVGFNVLAGGGDDWIADLIIHVLRELYAANWGQRTADVIHNSVLTLVRHGGMTLCELPPLLTNRTFRQMVTARLRDDVLGVAPFWHWFESISDMEQASVIAPVLNKVRAFTGRKGVRGVIGQVDGFDVKSVFTKRKILLVSLATGDAGADTGQLLGSLLMGHLWATIQSRSQIPPERRHPVFVYLDEFADVLRLPGDLGDALAKTRGLGVGFCLAHQHMAQLSPPVRAAVTANARSRIVFQSGYDDAGSLAKLLGGGLTATDLQQLALYETYQSLSLDGRVMAPASAVTLPLSPGLGIRGRVQAASRERFGVSRQDTDRALIERRTVTGPTSEVGGRRRRAS